MKRGIPSTNYTRFKKYFKSLYYKFSAIFMYAANVRPFHCVLKRCTTK